MGTIKYGFVYGVRCQIPVAIGDSVVFKDLGGNFVKYETTVDVEGRMQVVMCDTTAAIAGWLDVAESTSSSTAAQDIALLDVSPLSIYRVPVTAGTLSTADVGDYCDLYIDTNVQGIDASGGAGGYLIIVKRESSTVALVRMNPSKITGITAAAD
jgi:hypothetical protein